MNIILLTTYWALSLLIAVMQYRLSFRMRNIVLQTTLPEEAIDSPEVKQVLRRFLNRNVLVAIIFGVLILPILVIPYDSVVMVLFFLAVFGCLAFQFVMQVKSIGEMQELKLEKSWQTGSQKTLIDLKAVKLKNRKLFPIWYFIFPFILFVVQLVYELTVKTQAIVVVPSLVVFLLPFAICLFTYTLIQKMPTRTLTKDSEANLAVNDVQKSFYGRMILSLLIFFTLQNISMTFMAGDSRAVGVSLLIIFLLTLLFIVYVFALVFGYRRETNQLLAATQPLYYENEDQYWRYGIYMNPNDHRLFVTSRVTMKITVNLGQLKGKLITGFVGLALFASFIAVAVPLGYNDFVPHPFQVNQNGNELVLKNGWSSKEFPIAGIESVELITNNLDNLNIVRENGASTTNYSTGYYSINGQSAYLLVFNQEAKVIRIKTAGMVYYINDRTPTDTQKMYENVKEIVK